MKILFTLMFLTIVISLNGQSQEQPELQKVYKGTASFYHNKFHGRTMANGEKYSKDSLTAASNVLPINQWVRVTNIKNGKSVTVRITDKMASGNRRIIDLSRRAAEALEMISFGLVTVEVKLLAESQRDNMQK